MESGFKLGSGGRLDVTSDKGARKVLVEYRSPTDADPLPIVLTPSESRAIAYALTGASNEL